jgi:hypothetical protein
MKVGDRNIFAKVLICGLLVTATATATAQQAGSPRNSLPTNGEVYTGAIAILAVVGAGAGIGIYFLVHHNHNLTGCASVTPDGLRLRTDGDQQSYSLVGEIAAIKPGDRVRVSGKKQRREAAGTQSFLVEKVAKDFGVCRVQPATP